MQKQDSDTFMVHTWPQGQDWHTAYLTIDISNQTVNLSHYVHDADYNINDPDLLTKITDWLLAHFENDQREPTIQD